MMQGWCVARTSGNGKANSICPQHGLNERMTKPAKAKAATRLIPLYHQVYLHLKDMIAAWPEDASTPLPSEPKIAAQFGVSRVTVRATLAQLEKEGMVRRVHGVGTFPIRPGAAERTNIQGQLESLISFEDATTVRNIACHVSTAPTAIAAAALGPEPCLKVVRLRSYREQPVSFTVICVPDAFAGLIALPPEGNTPLIRTLERQGVVAVSAEQVLTAVAAPDEAAQHLAVAPGTPLIAMRRLMLDQHRVPILHQESLYVPDRFEYRMTLSRTSIAGIAKWTPTG